MLGRTVRLNARDYEIVGVAPEGFSGTMALVAPEFWLPLGVYAKVTDEMFRDGGSSRLSDPKNSRADAGRAAPPRVSTSTRRGR